MRHCSAACVRSPHIRYEIAQRIDYEYIFFGLVAVWPEFHRLYHVRVRAYNHVNADGFEEISRVLLLLVGQELVLVAPVYAHRHKLGSGLARGLHIGFYACSVDIVHNHAVARLYAVGTIGVIEKSELDVVDAHDFRQGADTGAVVGVCSDMRYAEAVECGYGGFQALAPLSRVWLLAVSKRSNPASESALANAGGALKHG